VILSDVMMGVVDGFMFRDSVRGFNAKIPIIFLTALMSTSTNRLMEKISADIYSHYVPKNARRDFLLGRLRQAVCAYRAEREAGLLKSRMESDLRIAARVQHALLPPAVRYDAGIFYSGLLWPRNIVCGDLYCWFPLSDHSAAIVFGDIAGHDAPAALSMTAVIAHLKELETSEGVATRRPERVCQEIDSYIRNNLRDVTYMAGTVLFVDFRERLVRYVTAGGIDPLCLRRCDGTSVDLNPDRRGGLPMGLMDGTTYTADDVVEAELPEDAILCLYSDGFVDLSIDPAGENRIPHDMFVEILSELVRGASGTSDVASIPCRLAQTLSDMGYVNSHDDRSICLIGNPAMSEMRFLATVQMKSSTDVNDVVDRAAGWAARRGFPDEFVARLELLLIEHLENVRKHGLDDDGRRHEIVVLEMRPADGGLEILAWDRGRPYDGDLSELAPHPDVTLDAQNELLATSGRGFAIVRKICRRVTHEHFGGLNKFTFLMETMSC